MDTILAQSGNRRRQRRSYTEEDKEHLIAICNQPGVSTACCSSARYQREHITPVGTRKGED
jgi:hypothetical protein